MLTELPTLVQDRFLRLYVSDNDLRVIHQVSKSWRDLVTSRPSVNARRISLVTHIQQERENIRDSTQEDQVESSKKVPNPIKRIKEDDSEKPGSRLPLGTTTNMISSNSSTPSDLPPSSAEKRSRALSSTPKSRKHQARMKFVQKLAPSQILFTCPGCQSPVASPVLPPRVKKEIKPIIKLDNELISGEVELSDSGISLCSPVSINKSTESRTDQVMNTPEYINVSLIATPPTSPSILAEEDSVHEVSELSISISNDIISSTSLNESLITSTSTSTSPSTQDPSPSPAEKPSLEDLRDGSHYAYLFNSSMVTRNQSSWSSSLPVNESQKRPSLSRTKSPLPDPPKRPSLNRTKSPLPDPQKRPSLSRTKSPLPDPQKRPSLSRTDPRTIFTKTLPKLDSSEGSENEELPYVLECQDCSYRFCSRCRFMEHSGKPCRLIGSGGMDDPEEFCDTSPLFKSAPSSSKSSGSGKSRSPKKGIKVKARNFRKYAS